MSVDIDLISLSAFAVAAVGAFSGIVLMSGYFPASERPVALLGRAGMLAIVAVAAVAALLAGAATLAAWKLPWAWAVVAGGVSFLAAPFVIEALPDRMRDSVFGATLYIVAGLGLLVILPLPA